MVKFPHSLYSETDTDSHSSSNENLKKKRKTSVLGRILKYATASAKRNEKCKMHAPISEPDEPEPRAQSLSRGPSKTLRGILKHTGQHWEEKRYYSSSEDEEYDYRTSLPPNKCLVGRVPMPPGKPGRGGGVALLVRKSAKYDQNVQPKQTSSSSKKSSHMKRLTRKRSY
ncbi:hypothetical protein O0L34_g3427 [Tuta absoluta]|nr:hypothetical protein O0L34_g3427 [Tuta absoluta]